MRNIENIIKRDGKLVPFDQNKISFAIIRAAVAVGGHDKNEAHRIAGNVVELLQKRSLKNSYPAVEEVQDLVEKCLIESGHAKTAKAYIVYRYEHALKRAGKQSLTYSSENIPYKKLWQALSWAVDHDCVSLSRVSSCITGGNMKQLIEISEAYYHAEVEAAAEEIMNHAGNVKIVIVAGPSSSGKTTTCLKLRDRLIREGHKLIPLNIDNYFFDLESHPKDGEGDYDFETPYALDLEMINKHLTDLLEGREINVPFYNFKKGRRDGNLGPFKLEPGDIILIDSLHGMYEKMTAGIPEENKCKIYIETLSQIKDPYGKYIRWSDIRMLRRMVRDKQFRNYNPRETVLHWHYVRRSELRYIIAGIKTAHIIINSFMPYELSVLKNRLAHYFPRFIKEWADNPLREDAFDRAQRVHNLFKDITAWTDETLIPGNSLLREFLGGSEYKY